MPPTTFIFTNSLDLTVDLLIHKIGSGQVFRYNLDLWQDYKLKIDHTGFFIENPVGRGIHSQNIEKFYWRRPHKSNKLYPDRDIPEELQYMEEEISYALVDMVNLLWAQGKVVLTEPMADSRIGKLVQLKVASKYFKVPPYKFVSGSSDYLARDQLSVVKSLTSNRIKGRGILYSTKVVENELDPSTPWFIQDYVTATHDITVVFVRGEVFGFELNREAFLAQTIDWRELGTDYATDAWIPHILPGLVVTAIRSYMSDLSLHFGRLDLLYYAGEYYFLEVNANGEWAWLDFDGKHGLLNRILEEIRPTTPTYPIPLHRGIRL